MTKLERKLRATLKRLRLDSASAVLIGVSGGADSMALLDAMHRLSQDGKWQGRLYGAHVNHLLRGAESEEDERFAQSCIADIPVVATRIDVAEQARATAENMEAVARRVRYEFFSEVAHANSIPLVFTAHTYDDQVETLLMRWMRGTGAAGLRGIREDRELEKGIRLIRPLLDVTRAEVLEHCAHYGIKYRTDSSNLTPDFTRNRVRQELLPLLRTFNPQIGAALLRSAEHWQADAACLDELAQDLFRRVVVAGKLQANELASSPTPLRLRVLRLWLAEFAELPELSATHWQALEWLATQCQSGRKIELPQGWRVQREFDWLRVWQESETASSLPAVRLVLGEPQCFGAYEVTVFPPMAKAQAESLSREPGISHFALLDASLVDHPLWLRTRQPGDAYVPEGRKSPVKLKTLLIRGKIPVSQRQQHPLLLAGLEIAWSPGLPVASAFSQLITSDQCVLAIVRERCNLSVPAGVI